MDVTRREFLGYASASLATAMVDRWPLGSRMPCEAGVLVLGDDCENAESLAGYGSALGTPCSVRRPFVILPAAVVIPPATVRLLQQHLAGGATVTIESGAAFLGERSDRLRNHRDLLHAEFGIQVERPMELWPAHGVPYIEYSWPRTAWIRDYSRAIPVLAQPDEVIATASGRAVALRQRCGSGTLIFLGAPLGPALLFGDAEAHRWLSAFIAT